jgi:hypothetical protein
MILLLTKRRGQRRTTEPGCQPRPEERRVIVVAHQITAREAAESGFTDRPGRFLFRGLWHGDRDPRSHKNFGKIEGQVGLPIGKVVGRRLSPFLLRKMRN